MPASTSSERGEISKVDGLKAGVGVGSGAGVIAELLGAGELEVGVGVGSVVKVGPELLIGLPTLGEGLK